MRIYLKYIIPKVEGYDDSSVVEKVLEKSKIVVGVPSRNTVHTIGYVLKMVVEGLEKYYRGTDKAIIVCDGLSSDGTIDVVNVIRKHSATPIVLVPNLRAPGKGSAVRTIIELTSELSSADVLVLVDSDLRSITPEWIPLLAETARKYGYATPLYIRHRYDATITNFIARPLTTMAYGIDIHQPIGGDFGLSRKLVDLLADNYLWTSNPWTQLFGVDIFITHTALANNVGVGEALLKAKIHEAKDPAKNLKKMFIEVTGTLFTVLVEYEDKWTNIRRERIHKPPVEAEPSIPDIRPWEVKVEFKKALLEFLNGLEKYSHLYTKYLGDHAKHLYEMKNGIDTENWIHILSKVYKYFKNTTKFKDRLLLLDSLYHLWQGRLYNYYNTVKDLSEEKVEELLEKEALSFWNARQLFIT